MNIRGMTAGLLALLLGACVSQTPITVSPGDDAWTRRVRDLVRPNISEALHLFGNELTTAGLPHASAPEPIHLRTRAGADAPAGSRVIELRSDMSERSLFERSLFMPLRKQAEDSSRTLAGPRYETLPVWLREGSAVMLSEAFIRAQDPAPRSQKPQKPTGLKLLSLDTGRDWAIRSPDAPRDAAAFLAAPAAGDSRDRLLGHAWLVAQLSGGDHKRFTRNWVCLLTSTARGNPYAEGFESCFHETPSAFEARIDAAITRARERRYEHNNPVPSASGFAKLEDATALPFRYSQSSVKGWQTFLTRPAPRAFAFGPNGAWAFVFDQPDAMSEALDICRRSDPEHCRLYAVDDQVVFQPETPTVKVLLQNPTPDTALEAWKTRLEKTGEVFLRTMAESSGMPLAYPATIRLAESRAEFEQSLSDALEIEGDTLEHYGTHASGVANGHGRIVMRLPDAEPPGLRARLVDEIALHELAHEWQGQLGHDRQGFVPPAWLVEGGAEYIAWVTGARLYEEADRQFDPDERMRDLSDLLRLGGLPAPSTLFRASRNAWRAMAGGKMEHYAGAELMIRYLAQRSRQDFLHAYADYFRRSGTLGETAEGAFKASFGLSPEEFLADYTRWLEILKSPAWSGSSFTPIDGDIHQGQLRPDPRTGVIVNDTRWLKH